MSSVPFESAGHTANAISRALWDEGLIPSYASSNPLSPARHSWSAETSGQASPALSPLGRLADQPGDHEHVNAVHRQSIAFVEECTCLFWRQRIGTKRDASFENHLFQTTNRVAHLG